MKHYFNSIQNVTNQKKKKNETQTLTGYPGSVSMYSNLSCAVFTNPKPFTTSILSIYYFACISTNETERKNFSIVPDELSFQLRG